MPEHQPGFSQEGAAPEGGAPKGGSGASPRGGSAPEGGRWPHGGRSPDRRRSGRDDVIAVGLTGGIGAGKSTALSMFAEQGAVTTSADAIVHGLYRSSAFISRLTERFGAEVLEDDGHIDRRAVAAKVKSSLDDLRWLEELTHPLVKDEIRRVVQGAPPGSVVVGEVPLMFEADFHGLFDLLVTVEAGQDNRLSRSAHRFDPVVFAEFEGLQATSDERVAGSDLVYWNDGSFDHMRMFVYEAYQVALTALAERAGSAEQGDRGRPTESTGRAAGSEGGGT